MSGGSLPRPGSWSIRPSRGPFERTSLSAATPAPQPGSLASAGFALAGVEEQEIEPSPVGAAQVLHPDASPLGSREPS